MDARERSVRVLDRAQCGAARALHQSEPNSRAPTSG